MINPVDSPALVGAPVFTPQGTQLGTIDSVRVDPGSGCPGGPACSSTALGRDSRPSPQPGPGTAGNGRTTRHNRHRPCTACASRHHDPPARERRAADQTPCTGLPSLRTVLRTVRCSAPVISSPTISGDGAVRPCAGPAPHHPVPSPVGVARTAKDAGTCRSAGRCRR